MEAGAVLASPGAHVQNAPKPSSIPGPMRAQDDTSTLGVEADDYHLLKRWSAELLSLPSAQREPRMVELSAQRPDLREALKALLAAADQPFGPLDRSLRPGVAEAAVMPRNYRLLGELGRGGMGVVWLAERSLDGVRQKVALKQALHAQIDPRLQRLFERERSILAGLDHPHIANLLDAGVDERGVAYLATPYIEGLDLDVHLRTHAPGLQERLHLLLKLMSAVAYAHRQLVVHCDIKPSNVRVDASGEPKLLDFGVARLLAEGSETRTIEQRVSLRYAAPEQIETPELRPGPAIDIHALGLLLYELLTGASPYPRDIAPSGLLQAILRGDLRPPSQCAAVAGVDRDLDAIVAMALRKRPEDRYASVEAFAEDLRRRLERRPVAARASERGYQLRSFLRKRWPALLGAAAVIAVAIGLAVVEVHRARAQLVALERERDKAMAIAHFYELMFSNARPEELQGDELSARELLQRSVAQIREGLRAQMSDDARAALYRSVADVLGSQGMHAEAIELYDRAIALWRSEPKPPARSLAEALNDRAMIDYRLGRLDAALAAMNEGAAVLRAGGEESSAAMGHILQMRGIVQRSMGDEQAADASMHEATAILRARLPEGQLYFASLLGNQGAVALYKGEAEAGLAYTGEALAVLAQLKPERVESVLGVQRTRASALRELGRFEESDRLYAEIEARARRELGEEHAHVAEALHSRALLRLAQGRWSEAEALFAAAQALHEARGGPQHPRAMAARVDRAWAALAAGSPGEAEQHMDALDRIRSADQRLDAYSAATEAIVRATLGCGREPVPSAADTAAMQEALTQVQRSPALPRALRLERARAWARDCGVPADAVPPSAGADARTAAKMAG